MHRVRDKAELLRQEEPPQNRFIEMFRDFVRRLSHEFLRIVKNYYIR